MDDVVSDDRTRSRWLRVVAPPLVIAALAIVAIVVVVSDDDSEDVTTSPTTTQVVATSTASTAPGSATTRPTATTTTVAAADTDVAVFPSVSSDVRFTDPVDAATRFATDFVGFTDPVVGAFLQGDARSGEVEVRPRADGPVTTVLVRQLGTDDSWWVLGAVTANVEVDDPAALATIGSPVHLSGRARAFEGNVNVEIRQDGVARPLATGFVTGRGDGVLGPFASDLEFTTASSPRGAVVFVTHSAEDGSVWEAGVVRVTFAAP